MNHDQASFAARVISLYLDDPDTPQLPTPSDWDIAHGLFSNGVPLETIQLAFWLAYVRRRKSTNADLPPIRSLAYFRTVALNLTPEEQDPTFVEHVRRLYQQLRTVTPAPASTTPHQNGASQPIPRPLS